MCTFYSVVFCEKFPALATSFKKFKSKPKRSNNHNVTCIITIFFPHTQTHSIHWLLLFLRLPKTVATTHSTTGSHITRQAMLMNYCYILLNLTETMDIQLVLDYGMYLTNRLWAFSVHNLTQVHCDYSRKLSTSYDQSIGICFSLIVLV